MHKDNPNRHGNVAKTLVLILMLCSMRPLRLNAQVAQTLRIESLDLVTTRRTLEQVRVRVRNLTPEPQTGIIWYVLASPGEKEPWRVNAFSLPEVSIQLAPAQTRTIQLSVPDQALDGRFELSVWLHGVNRTTGERFFSDYRVHQAPLLVAPRFSFSMDAGKVEGNEASLIVRFSVRYNDEESASIGIRYQVGQKGDRPSPDGPFVHTVRIASGVDYVMAVRHLDRLPSSPDGRLRVTGWLYEFAGAATYLKTSAEVVVKRND